MPTIIDIKQSEATVQLVFAEPEVDLFEPFPRFLGGVLTSLGPHGLRLSDTRLENQGVGLGEVHLRCLLHGGASQVRFFLDKLEIATELVRPFDEMRALMAAGFEALRSRPKIRTPTAVTSLAMHFATPTPLDLIRSLGGAAPSGFGPVVGSGAHFYFGAEGTRLATLLDCDLSRVVAGGLFFRLNIVHDIEHGDSNQAVSTLEEGFGQVLATFELMQEPRS